MNVLCCIFFASKKVVFYLYLFKSVLSWLLQLFQTENAYSKSGPKNERQIWLRNLRQIVFLICPPKSFDDEATIILILSNWKNERVSVFFYHRKPQDKNGLPFKISNTVCCLFNNTFIVFVEVLNICTTPLM